MEAISLPIYNTDGNQIETLRLDPTVFDGAVNTHAIYQTVIAFKAAQRKGLASTKTMGEVSGGGRKPWKQKGTGRARVGSIRSPLWRHGGVIFGPHPKDFSYTLPTKLKRLALKSSLNAKINEKNFIVVDNLKIGNPKTKEAMRFLYNLKIPEAKNKKVLLLLDKIDQNLRLSFHNIDFLRINRAEDTHAYEVLSAHKLIMTKEALRQLTDKFKK